MIVGRPGHLVDVRHHRHLRVQLDTQVADRLCAAPRTKAYGVLSVLLGTCAEIKQLIKIGPGQFHPRPKVDSVVVSISFLPISDRIKNLPQFDRKTLTMVVKNAFQQRRKTLSNALSAAAINDTTKPDVLNILRLAGIEPSIRPDQLSIEQYIEITRCYTSYKTP